MATNFHSFSPNAGVDEEPDRIELVAGDAGAQLRLWLKDSDCGTDFEGFDPEDVSTWPPLDLTSATEVSLYFLVEGETESEKLHCTIILPLIDGICLAHFRPGFLDDKSGNAEAEIEARFNDGRIVTVYEKVFFSIRADLSGNG